MSQLIGIQVVGYHSKIAFNLKKKKNFFNYHSMADQRIILN